MSPSIGSLRTKKKKKNNEHQKGHDASFDLLYDFFSSIMVISEVERKRSNNLLFTEEQQVEKRKRTKNPAEINKPFSIFLKTFGTEISFRFCFSYFPFLSLYIYILRCRS